MTQTSSRPLEKYKEAFIRFSDSHEKDIEIKFFEGALVRYNNMTYRVCHYDDLLYEFKTYFSNYDLIYTETPFGLWQRMMEDHWDVPEENLVIDIYEAWKTYWEQQRMLYTNNHIYNESKADSWEDFKLLVADMRSGPGNLIENALHLSDITLIPILAIAIKRQFSNEDNFYSECLDLMIDHFPEYFASDGNFDEIDLAPGQQGTELYYIYQPDYGYDHALT